MLKPQQAVMAEMAKAQTLRDPASHLEQGQHLQGLWGWQGQAPSSRASPPVPVSQPHCSASPSADMPASLPPGVLTARSFTRFRTPLAGWGVFPTHPCSVVLTGQTSIPSASFHVVRGSPCLLPLGRKLHKGPFCSLVTVVPPPSHREERPGA